jgi:DNA-binding response OmpR family regulator
MLPAIQASPSTVKHRPRVLIVDDEPGLIDVLDHMLKAMDCDVHIAKTFAQAKRKLIGESFELLVTDLHLPDGDGMSLLATLRRHQPIATAIVITGQPSVDRAITALRDGAVDFVPKPFSSDQLTERVRKALNRQSILSRQEKRIARLRGAVKKLGVARRMVSQKVDLLCNDLVNAYGELSRQLDTVRTQENFRKQIAQATDLEQLLCHTMDWLLRQIGSSNVALWLSGDDGNFQLGAYMKHTIAGDEKVADAMLQGLLPAIVRDGSIHIRGEELNGKLKKEDAKTFAQEDILGISAAYLGEPLAAMIFFRDSQTPFNELDEATLKAIAPVFATALATIVRDPSLPAEGDAPFLDPEDEDGRGSREAGDWWKRGESPPF